MVWLVEVTHWRVASNSWFRPLIVGLVVKIRRQTELAAKSCAPQSKTIFSRTPWSSFLEVPENLMVCSNALLPPASAAIPPVPAWRKLLLLVTVWKLKATTTRSCPSFQQQQQKKPSCQRRGSWTDYTSIGAVMNISLHYLSFGPRQTIERARWKWSSWEKVYGTVIWAVWWPSTTLSSVPWLSEVFVKSLS